MNNNLAVPPNQGPWPVGAEYQWWVLLALVYLPAIALVLRRPNEAESAWSWLSASP